MSQTRKNLIVGQSGGPTAAINSSLYGVVKEGLNEGITNAVDSISLGELVQQSRQLEKNRNSDRNDKECGRQMAAGFTQRLDNKFPDFLCKRRKLVRRNLLNIVWFLYFF